MRTLKDRIRHTVLFELLAFSLVMLMGLLFLDKSAKDIGMVSIVMTLIAMSWNFVYNLVFDKLQLALTGSLVKTPKVRMVTALGFEFGLLIITLPILAWALQLTLLQAFIADIALVVFFLFYAYGFNVFYDKVFPVTPDMPCTLAFSEAK